MARMTEEEADYWDDYYTKNPPKIDPSKKGGYFTRQRELLEALDKVSADYIISCSMSSNKMPAQIIGEMAKPVSREKLAVINGRSEAYLTTAPY